MCRLTTGSDSGAIYTGPAIVNAITVRGRNTDNRVYWPYAAQGFVNLIVIWVLPHFRCSSRPGDQGKALRCFALPTSRTAPVSNRQQARNRPRTSLSLNEITVLV